MNHTRATEASWLGGSCTRACRLVIIDRRGWPTASATVLRAPSAPITAPYLVHGRRGGPEAERLIDCPGHDERARRRRKLLGLLVHAYWHVPTRELVGGQQAGAGRADDYHGLVHATPYRRAR